MIVIDKHEFDSWTNNEFIDFSLGDSPNEDLCSKVADALDSGEAIALSSEYEIVCYVKKIMPGNKKNKTVSISSYFHRNIFVTYAPK